MNVLWITNIPIGDISKEMFSKPMGGLWMDALLFQLKGSDAIHHVIITTIDTNFTIEKEYKGTKYYLLPGGNPVSYKRDDNEARNEWTNIINKESIDFILVWGTEYSHAIPALEVAKKLNVPSVIYIQGIMKAISRFADGLVPFSKIFRYTTLRDIYRGQIWAHQDKWFAKHAIVEDRLIKLSDGVIVENNWAEIFCKSINPELTIYRVPLNINSVFYNEKWDYINVIPHSIISNASGPAYKGIHITLHALTLIKKKYPDVKLYIPGKSMMTGNILSRQKVPGYWNYITDFIKNHKLESNVEFTGYLTQTQLAKKLSETNVFVLSSSIENHSSSLKEAMAVGTPSVVSQVGGVSEYFVYGECGFSYRYEEYECLAGYICKLFEDTDLCAKFSATSRIKARLISEEDIASMILSMYNDLYENKLSKKHS